MEGGKGTLIKVLYETTECEVILRAIFSNTLDLQAAFVCISSNEYFHRQFYKTID